MVQTAIILLLSPGSNPLVPDISFKWALVGTLVSMSETMGLHLDPLEWNIPRHQVVLRRRLSSIVYALDTWFALSLGRPPHISQENWLVDQLEETDVPVSESEDFSSALHFSKLTRVAKLVLQRLL